MKKISRTLACFLTIMVLSFCLVSCGADQEPVVAMPKNLIYVIGDGMGFQHLQVCKDYFELPDYEFEKCFFSSVTTYSQNCETTDSAAGGTALATGQKVNNGTVAIKDDQPLITILDIAKNVGYLTGIVTTDTLYGATPAAFSAHAYNRNDVVEIIQTQANSGVNYLVGQTDDYILSQTAEYETNGYICCEKLDDYRNAVRKTVLNINIDHEQKNNALKDLVTTTLEKFGDQKFALMVEAAHIDKYSHGNDFHRAMWEVRKLYDLMEYLYEYAQTHNAALILTADHETGGLGADYQYRTTNHSAANVPLYMYNIETTARNFVDNIDVFTYAKSVIK